MRIARCHCAYFLIGLFVVGTCSEAMTLTFEGYPDGTIVTTQYPGMTFANAIISTAGISLNEFEFPPHSGVNVATDNGGPISIYFSTPVTSFSAYFTYAEQLTLDAFGSGNLLLTSTVSAFSNNEAISGDVGSESNEFMQLFSTAGIFSVMITGDPAGGSFVMDDVTYGTVPEPSPWALCIIGLAILIPRPMQRLCKWRHL